MSKEGDDPPGAADSSARPAAPRRGTWPSSSPLAEAHGPIVHTIFRISRKNRAMVANLLRPLGLYPGQELLMMQLWEHKARSQADLVEALGIDHSTVTKMLQRMQAAGLVERQASRHDRRVMLVSLTDAGRRLRDEIERIWQEMERLTVAHLNERQRAQLLTLLRSVEARIEPTTTTRHEQGNDAADQPDRWSAT